MSSSQLHSQLESLFEDIQAIEELVVPGAEGRQDSWYLHCNDQGYILSCSPEVETVLGYNPGYFTGRHFSDFLLNNDAAEELFDSLENSTEPQVIKLSLLSDQGQPLPAVVRLEKQDAGYDWFGSLTLDSVVPSPPIDLRPQEEEFFRGEEEDDRQEEASEEFDPSTDEAPFSEVQPDREAKRTNGSDHPLVPTRPRPGRRTRPVDPGLTRPVDPDLTRPVTDKRPVGTGPLALSASVKDASDEEPAVLAVPMQTQFGQEAILEIVDDTPNREWTEDERRLVEEVAGQLSLALENAELFSQTQTALNETETQAIRLAHLNELSEMLSRATDIDEV
ncbi:MAG: hypothetical protein R3335_12160, partial [Anaerolineales bacterium]|nr:hypothetical protein [Anaerolineales bacterium]